MEHEMDNEQAMDHQQHSTEGSARNNTSTVGSSTPPADTSAEPEGYSTTTQQVPEEHSTMGEQEAPVTHGDEQQHEEQQPDKLQQKDFPVHSHDEQQHSGIEDGADEAAEFNNADLIEPPMNYPAAALTAARTFDHGDHHTHHGTNSHSNAWELTFSGPPYVPKAKAYQRADYSHSKGRLIKIAHDNQLLVQRLTSISKQEPSWSKDLTHTAPSNTASSSVNRRKQTAKIAQENHALYQRLVAIKPSKDISRETLEAEHRRNEAYRINCAQYKDGASSPSHEQ